MSKKTTPAAVSADCLHAIRNTGALMYYADRTLRGDHLVGVGFVPHSWAGVRGMPFWYPLAPASVRRLKTRRVKISEAEFFALLDREQTRLNEKY